VAFSLVVLAGCEVDTTVTIRVREDGSGTVAVRVVLDAEAVAEAEVGGGTLEDRVRLAGLEAAGWKVSPWKRRPAGATLRISKEFAEPEDLEGVLVELSGPDGPVRDVSLRVDEGALRTEYDLEGTADLSDLRTGVTTDAELVARLTAEQVDLAALDQRLLDQVREAFRLEVKVALPGETRTFTPKSGQRVALAASSTRWEPSRAVFFELAAVSGLLALLLLVVARRRPRSRRHRRGERA
jgi:hypothetical protein